MYNLLYDIIDYILLIETGIRYACTCVLFNMTTLSFAFNFVNKMLEHVFDLQWTIMCFDIVLVLEYFYDG